MNLKSDDLPSDLARAQAALLVEREARQRVEAERDAAVAEAASAKAKLSDTEALIAHLQLRIEKLKRELHGSRSEPTARLIEQLKDLVMSATEDELAARAAAAKTQTVRAFTRKRPVRKAWPDDIERERVVIDPPVPRGKQCGSASIGLSRSSHPDCRSIPPTTCACCGGARLSKLGEDVTRTLEAIPRRF